MRTITLFASILFMVVFSLSAMAGDNRLINAIQHTQRAVTAVDGMDVTKHAEVAKNHANAAKTVNDGVKRYQISRQKCTS